MGETVDGGGRVTEHIDLCVTQLRNIRDVGDLDILAMLEAKRGAEQAKEPPDNWPGFMPICGMVMCFEAGWPDMQPCCGTLDDRARAACLVLAERIESLRQRRLVCVYAHHDPGIGDNVCITQFGREYLQAGPDAPSGTCSPAGDEVAA